MDWTNFFIADVQTGFGTYVAFYLAQRGWSQSDVGWALTIGGLAGVLSQIPGGALADATTWKRGLITVGIVTIGAAALILAFSSSFILVIFAELLHGITAGIITPAMGAISLGLVGRRAMSLRTGRNYRYAAGGHAMTAIMMGLAGTFFSVSAMFLSAAGTPRRSPVCSERTPTVATASSRSASSATPSRRLPGLDEPQGRLL